MSLGEKHLRNTQRLPTPAYQKGLNLAVRCGSPGVGKGAVQQLLTSGLLAPFSTILDADSYFLLIPFASMRGAAIRGMRLCWIPLNDVFPDRAC